MKGLKGSDERIADSNGLIASRQFAGLAVMVACMVGGVVMPGVFWATDAWACFGLASWWVWLGVGAAWVLLGRSHAGMGSGWIWAIGLGLLFSVVAMPFDVYGESAKLFNRLDEFPTAISDGAFDSISALTLGPWSGQDFTLGLVEVIAVLLGSSFRQAFVLLDSVCMVAFALAAFSFVRHWIGDKKEQKIWLMVILSAPFVVNFMGHTEINAPALTTQLIALHVLMKPGKKWVAVLVWLIALKFHASALLFLPVLIGQICNTNWTANRAVLWVFTPLFLGFLVLYVFVFEDYNDPRELQSIAMAYDRLFLPVIPAEEPLHRYHMFSLSHFWDMIMEFMLWVPAMLAPILAFKWRGMKMSQPAWRGFIMMIPYMGLFFVTNPLLSMPMDWDLFSFPAVPFLVFCIIFFHDQIKLTPTLKTAMIVASSLQLTWMVMHTQSESIGRHLVNSSHWIHRSYYEWAANTLQWGIRAQEVGPEDSYEIMRQSHASMEGSYTWDRERSWIAIQLAKTSMHDFDDLETARIWLDAAYEHSPLDGFNTTVEMEWSYLSGNFAKAYFWAMKRMNDGIVSPVDGWLAALHCAAAGQLKPEAETALAELVKLDPASWAAHEGVLDSEGGFEKLMKKFEGG